MKGLLSPSTDAPVAASDYVEDVVLTADTLVRVPIPANAVYVNMTFTDNFRAKFGTAATTLTLPTATSTDGSGSALSPAVRRVPAGATHLCLRAPTACNGSLEFWG